MTWTYHGPTLDLRYILWYMSVIVVIHVTPGLVMLMIIPDSKVHGGQHGAHLEPTGPMWASCWPQELCYLEMNLVAKLMGDSRIFSMVWCNQTETLFQYRINCIIWSTSWNFENLIPYHNCFLRFKMLLKFCTLQVTMLHSDRRTEK